MLELEQPALRPHPGDVERRRRTAAQHQLASGRQAFQQHRKHRRDVIAAGRVHVVQHQHQRLRDGGHALAERGQGVAGGRALQCAVDARQRCPQRPLDGGRDEGGQAAAVGLLLGQPQPRERPRVGVRPLP